MIVEQRTDTLQPRLTAACLMLYEAGGLAVQTGHPGDPVDYNATEIGDLDPC